MIIGRVYEEGKRVEEHREYRSKSAAESAATQLRGRGWSVATAYPHPSVADRWWLVCTKEWDSNVKPLR